MLRPTKQASGEDTRRRRRRHRRRRRTRILDERERDTSSHDLARHVAS